MGPRRCLLALGMFLLVAAACGDNGTPGQMPPPAPTGPTGEPGAVAACLTSQSSNSMIVN